MKKNMKACCYCAVAGLMLSAATYAQERVVAANDKEALFHSSDPRLNANKQAAYHMVKDIPESTTPATIDKYLTERYIQHNPNMPSGRDSMKKMMTILKPKPVTDKMTEPVVTVVAEGDYVVVSTVLDVPDPKNPGKTYTTTHFDMWRMKDGKADEHWDSPVPESMGPPPHLLPENLK